MDLILSPKLFNRWFDLGVGQGYNGLLIRRLVTDVDESIELQTIVMGSSPFHLDKAPKFGPR